MFANLRIPPALIAIAVLAFGLALAIGCGGGGGGGGTTGGTSGSITPAYVIYGVKSTVSPTLSPGDQVTLTASVTIDGVTSQVTPYNYVVHGGSTVGTVTAQGVFTAGSGVASGVTYTITANSSVGGVEWQFTGGATISQPIVVGVVEASATVGPVAGATITAYDSQGNVVGTATSGASGAFSMPVTSAATKFGVTIGGVDQSSMTFYPEFGYGAAEYDTTNPACLPALPALNTGNHHYPLAYPIVLNTELYNNTTYPPPPPPGCFQ